MGGGDEGQLLKQRNEMKKCEARIVRGDAFIRLLVYFWSLPLSPVSSSSLFLPLVLCATLVASFNIQEQVELL